MCCCFTCGWNEVSSFTELINHNHDAIIAIIRFRQVCNEIQADDKPRYKWCQEWIQQTGWFSIRRFIPSARDTCVAVCCNVIMNILPMKLTLYSR